MKESPEPWDTGATAAQPRKLKAGNVTLELTEADRIWQEGYSFQNAMCHESLGTATSLS